MAERHDNFLSSISNGGIHSVTKDNAREFRATIAELEQMGLIKQKYYGLGSFSQDYTLTDDGLLLVISNKTFDEWVKLRADERFREPLPNSIINSGTFIAGNNTGQSTNQSDSSIHIEMPNAKKQTAISAKVIIKWLFLILGGVAAIATIYQVIK